MLYSITVIGPAIIRIYLYPFQDPLPYQGVQVPQGKSDRPGAILIQEINEKPEVSLVDRATHQGPQPSPIHIPEGIGPLNDGRGPFKIPLPFRVKGPKAIA